MADTLFQYPGGKSGQFDRIKDLMPKHECFVEGFGGSGVITLNKEPAEVDVYNDLDSELVHFFIVYREAPDRLVDWLQDVKYSYETYEDFVTAFYGEAGEEREEHLLPGDTLTNNLITEKDISYNHVRRAGIFFFLRYTQFGAKYQGRSGFGRSKVQNGAETFANARERLREFSGCWDHVTIENVSYEKLADTYDSPDSLFYFDPPYVGTEHHYRESDFSHGPFVDTLKELEGMFIVSYDELPTQLESELEERDGWYSTVEESTNFIDSGVSGEGKDTIETLVMNFEPHDVEQHNDMSQNALADFDSDTDVNQQAQEEKDQSINLFDGVDEDQDESSFSF
jgi:DNA adenine methylase